MYLYRKIICISLVVALSILTAFLVSCSEDDKEIEEEPVSIELYAMDTYMTLSAYGDSAEEALSECEKEIKRIDALLSTGNADSEISILNKEKRLKVSEETFNLIKRAKEIGEDVGGVFDVSIYPVMKAWGFADQDYRVPGEPELKTLLKHVDLTKIRLDEKSQTIYLDDSDMELDLGGIAKGYTSDRIKTILEEHGVEHALVNLGGNVEAFGDKPDGSGWRVAIIDPEDQGEYVGGVEVSDKAVITSGGYQRYFEKDGKTYFHIIDPKDGHPAENGLISVTVVSEDGTLADALSTSLFVMGAEKAADYWRKNRDEFDAVLVKDDGTVLVTEGLKESYFSDSEYGIIR